MSDNAILQITINQFGGKKVIHKTEDFLDINEAHDTYRNIIERKLSVTIRQPGGSSCKIISGAGITDVEIAEMYPEIEARKAAERQATKLKDIDRANRVGRIR